jgi:L-amino acid N-acyltransferase YncA
MSLMPYRKFPMPTECQREKLDIALRRPCRQDCEEILRWRNDETTRSMSLETGIVALSTHRVWFENVLSDIRRHAFVATMEDQPVGWIRFDPMEGYRKFQVSISVSPDRRSLGIGNFLLSNGLRQLLETAEVFEVHATVKKENKSSISLFKRKNFIETETNPLFKTLIFSNNRHISS